MTLGFQFLAILPFGVIFRVRFLAISDPAGFLLGGDPAAGSPTATLLRLQPAQRTYHRIQYDSAVSGKPVSRAATGGVCKAPGRIQRALLKCAY